MLPPLPRCSGWAYSSLISPRRVSLPRKGHRVGLHIVLFEACSAFTRVAACTLARSPYFVTRYPKASDISSPPCLLRLLSGWSDLPGGACTHWKAPPCHGAHPEQEFFADGIAEDIITALSRYPSLFVIARNSCFTYKGRAVDVKLVGRELGVRYVLEGGLRKSGNRIRVTAQLVEAETGNHVWAERYDRDLADIFAVQDEITEAVTIAVTPAVAQAEQQRAMRKPPQNLDAWGACQRGLWHLGKANAEDNALAE